MRIIHITDLAHVTKDLVHAMAVQTQTLLIQAINQTEIVAQ
ncbi:MAG: hypothetical protein K0R90_127 [Oscillospiraceae bacterium]|jgi:hypothetical protein|nr:hypothetical protein [Oscillospiraceae bacterium]